MKAALIVCLLVGAGCLSKLDDLTGGASPTVTFPSDLLCVPTETTMAEVPGGQVHALFSAAFVMIKIDGVQGALPGCPDTKAWSAAVAGCLERGDCGKQGDPGQLKAYREQAAGSGWQALNLAGYEADVQAAADTYVVVARRGGLVRFESMLDQLDSVLGGAPVAVSEAGAAATGGICGDHVAAPCLPGQCEPKSDVPVREAVIRYLPDGGIPAICACEEVCAAYKDGKPPQDCDCLDKCQPCP